jgi:3,4-dihydroxy 2-butanone 4-phosphate synthase/GTP cyclohydrolase II
MTPSAPPAPVGISPVEEIVADIRAGRMVILVDEEDRENEGDLVLAADHVTPEAINFMARFGRGLVCLTLTRERCERLRLPPMVARNGDQDGHGVHRLHRGSRGRHHRHLGGRPRAHRAGRRGAQRRAEDLVQPGHIFPLQAVDGGVLMRAGHTEAGCDLAGMAGLTPAAVICEIMKDDGTMARLPDLQLFAAEHGLKIGTIADLIEHRSRHESLVEKIGSRPLHTNFGTFTAHAWRDKPSRACTWRWWSAAGVPTKTIPVRVHEPLSVLDALETARPMHSWSLDASLQHIARRRQGRRRAAELRRIGRAAAGAVRRHRATASQAPERGRMDLRTYGVGAQILRECGVHRMTCWARRAGSPAWPGYGLEIAGHLAPTRK